MVLPADSHDGTDPATSTLNRLAFIATPVTVTTYRTSAAAPLEPDWSSIEQLIIPPRHRIFAASRQDDTIKVGEYDLGDRQHWVDALADIAEQHFGLEPAHRLSYLSWHTEGRKLLEITTTSKAINITAGTQYAKHRTGKTPPVRLSLDRAPNETELTRIGAAIQASIEDRLAGIDTENGEHLLQARLATPLGVAALGLVGNLEREVPATRPGSRRAYIDLLGVDDNGNIHVIETKLEDDPMLAIQGLDYWTWATEHTNDLTALLRSRGHTVADRPRIILDYVIGTKTDSGGTPNLAYLHPQLEHSTDPSKPRSQHSPAGSTPTTPSPSHSSKAHR